MRHLLEIWRIRLVEILNIRYKRIPVVGISLGVILLLGIYFTVRHQERVIEHKLPDNITITTPEPNSVLDSKDIAIPELSTPALGGSSKNIRTFSLKGEKGAFTPSIIVVNQGDIIHINLIATDKPYSFLLPGFNIEQSAVTGQSKSIEFQATSAGKFDYYQNEEGRKSGKASGYILIKAS